MKVRAHVLTAALVLGVALALMVRTGASAEEPREAPPVREEPSNWSIILRQQAIADKRCEVREILHFREFDLGSDRAVEGKIACVDGRQYDFSRPRAHQPFRFEICEPTVC